VSWPVLAIIAPIKAWGGIEGKLVTLTAEFLARGVQPELVLVRGGQIPYPERLSPEVSVVELTTTSKRDGAAALARYLRTRRPAAVLTTKDHGAQVALLARLWARVSVPVFVKVTNTLSLVARRRLQRFMIRRLYPLADGILGNSQGVCDDLVARFAVPAARITKIYNPTLTADFASRSARPVEHPWLGDTAEIPVIVGVGRLTPQKDFAMLVDAFARLRQRRAARLIIVGDGPGRGELEARAAHHGIEQAIDLPGFVDDAVPWIARARIFALASRYEGLSNVLIEALAAGTPAVATDCPSGCAEILEHGRYGALVPVGDAEAMRDALERELDSPTDPGLLAQAGERFKAGPVAERYLATMGLARAASAA